jgi:hypothetical protein
MSYLSLASIVAEANRASSAAERLLDLGFQPVEYAQPKPDVKQEKPAAPADDSSGTAATELGKIIDQYGIMNKNK